MVHIEPVQIWNNGVKKEATKLIANINDNLKDSGLVYYRLSTEDGSVLAEGNLTMKGEAYEDWQEKDYAYNWIASELNLVIIEPPVVEE